MMHSRRTIRMAGGKVTSFWSRRLAGFKGVTLLLLTLPPLFWSGNFIVARAMRGAIPPLTLSFSRWVIALLVLLPFAIPALRRQWPQFLPHWRLLLLTSLTGIAGFNTLVYLGLQTTPATNGLLLNSTIPVFICLLGTLSGSLRLGGSQWLGLLISLSGVILIISHGQPLQLLQLAFSRGDLLVLLAMLCWAIYTIALKQLPAELDRLALMTLQIVLGLGMLLPAFAWEQTQGGGVSWSLEVLLGLAYVGVVPSVLAYLLYGACVSRLGPARAGLSVHLIPVFGVLLAVALLGEQLHGFHLLGMLLIVIGLLRR